MDCIRIRNLEVFGHHGVYEEENKLGQKFVVCADIFVDLRTAGLNDEMSQSINYGDICMFMNDFMRENTYYLIEAAAEQMARALLLKFDKVLSIKLTIKKPWAPIGLPLEEVAVQIERGWHDVYIGLGSNMGDKKDYIVEAVKRMGQDDDIRIIEKSSLIKTKPYGKTDQPDFLNGVVHIKTIYTPSELLVCMNELETLAGRKREEHWGPRTLDLDILFYDDLMIDSKDLTIPHYDIKNRDFVLKPLCELAPWLRHPVTKKTVREMLDELSAK
ncbi:MAG: 2-amino-4-hydroxy-6-hydroxymethyldihydropteridine diphosphokinase [Lachnospiraceae bacterium]|nr:2-amino-4-hydroxy-6-hydroxymethyldihydropteridine diphosphokinase [Lachnospiraceae bacterium]